VGRAKAPLFARDERRNREEIRSVSASVDARQTAINGATWFEVRGQGRDSKAKHSNGYEYAGTTSAGAPAFGMALQASPSVRAAIHNPTMRRSNRC